MSMLTVDLWVAMAVTKWSFGVSACVSNHYIHGQEMLPRAEKMGRHVNLTRGLTERDE